jgi:uncharacterized protein (TIGR00730 family)
VAAVFGSARLASSDPEYQQGVRLGRLLAERGWTVQTGGYDGMMGAVSRGAHAGGGHVVGVTLQSFRGTKPPNEWVLEEREAEDLFARVRGLVQADAWIGLAGGIGTLAEVALAWNLHQNWPSEARPLVLVGPRWAELVPAIGRLLVVDGRDLGIVRLATDVDEAVAIATDGVTRPARPEGGATA